MIHHLPPCMYCSTVLLAPENTDEVGRDIRIVESEKVQQELCFSCGNVRSYTKSERYGAILSSRKFYPRETT